MKVLLSAFTCGPQGGSEPGAGWAWALAAAHEHDVWVLTRYIPSDRVEEAAAAAGFPTMRFVYVEPPGWVRRVLRGGVGLRLSYLFWQRRARGAACRLHHEIGFDLVHHVTFANVWLPAGVAGVEAPFVLGPVGGGPRIPLKLWPELGVRGALAEALRTTAQCVSRLNPTVRRGWRRARVIVAQNNETIETLPRRCRDKCRVRPHAAVLPAGAARAALPPRPAPAGAPEIDPVPGTAYRVAVYAGRLVAWKGSTLALRALVGLEGWRLIVVGSGPQFGRLRALAHRLDLESRVEFRPWLERDALQQLLERADVVVVPSLRDDSPFIVAEAQALGRPVAAFDQGGLSVFAQLPDTRIELASLGGTRRDAVRSLREAIVRAAQPGAMATAEAFSLDGIVHDLRDIYETALGSPLDARMPRDGGSPAAERPLAPRSATGSRHA